MTTQAEKDAALTVLVALGDQVQALCQNAGVPMAAFVLFSQAGPVEYRSPHPIEFVAKHMHEAADELLAGQ